MRPLPPGAQFGQGGREDRLLGGDEPLQIVGIGLGHAISLMRPSLGPSRRAGRR